MPRLELILDEFAKKSWQMAAVLLLATVLLSCGRPTTRVICLASDNSHGEFEQAFALDESCKDLSLLLLKERKTLPIPRWDVGFFKETETEALFTMSPTGFSEISINTTVRNAKEAVHQTCIVAKQKGGRKVDPE
jgi:hypothetical protein